MNLNGFWDDFDDYDYASLFGGGNVFMAANFKAN